MDTNNITQNFNDWTWWPGSMVKIISTQSFAAICTWHLLELSIRQSSDEHLPGATACARPIKTAGWSASVSVRLLSDWSVCGSVNFESMSTAQFKVCNRCWFQHYTTGCCPDIGQPVKAIIISHIHKPYFLKFLHMTPFSKVELVITCYFASNALTLIAFSRSV